MQRWRRRWAHHRALCTTDRAAVPATQDRVAAAPPLRSAMRSVQPPRGGASIPAARDHRTHPGPPHPPHHSAARDHTVRAGPSTEHRSASRRGVGGTGGGGSQPRGAQAQRRTPRVRAARSPRGGMRGARAAERAGSRYAMRSTRTRALAPLRYAMRSTRTRALAPLRYAMRSTRSRALAPLRYAMRSTRCVLSLRCATRCARRTAASCLRLRTSTMSSHVPRVAGGDGVAGVPELDRFGVQPVDVAGALGEVLQHPGVGLPVVVAGVAEDDDGGARGDVAGVVGVELLEAVAVVGVAVEPDELGLDHHPLDRLGGVALVEQAGHLVEGVDERERADLAELLLQRVDQHQREPGERGDRPGHVADDEQLGLVRAARLERRVERHAAGRQRPPDGPADVEAAVLAVAALDGDTRVASLRASGRTWAAQLRPGPRRRGGRSRAPRPGGRVIRSATWSTPRCAAARRRISASTSCWKVRRRASNSSRQSRSCSGVSWSSSSTLARPSRSRRIWARSTARKTLYWK